VERAHPEVARDALADDPVEPAAHLAGRFVRERDGEDAVRRHAVVRDEVRDAEHDDARLAAARAREDEQRPVDVRGRAGLGLVELREIGLRAIRRLVVRICRDLFHKGLASTI
jgi:hypothetical protein